MSIRIKLAAVLALACLLTVLATGAMFVAIERRALRLSEEEKISFVLTSVKAMAQEAQLARDPLMLLDYMSHLDREREEVVHTRVKYDGRDEPVPGSSPPPQSDSVRTETIEIVAVGKGPAIEVSVDFSRQVLALRFEESFRQIVVNLSRACAVVLLVMVLISIPLGWSLTSRLLVIEKAMAEVGKGKLDREVPGSGSDEVGRLAKSLNAMIAKLRELDDMKRTFVSSVTHELRTPLVSIESYVGLLLKESKTLGDEERRQLERIQANALRLEHFVTSLLDMAKIERGKLDFRPREVQVAGLIEDAVLFQKPRALEQQKTLTYEADPDLPSLHVDPDLITQVVTNLVSNAIKFTRAKGEIHVTLKKINEGVECKVKDTGVGIPAPALARLFVPFERVSNPLKASGTGLGLSISKALIEMHGGTMSVESEVGRGSAFRFFIPANNKSLIRKKQNGLS